MTHGLLITNNNNQVLVSSDTRNLHFIGKYTSPTLDASTDFYGGMRRFTYRVTCNVTPVPFFTMPTEDFYGITGIRNVSGDQWDIEMLRSGTGAGYPELYVFSDPRGKTPPSGFGMQVLASDGTPAFDSRLKPLAISGGTAVTHPSNPRPTFPYGMNAKYCGDLGATAGTFFEPTESNVFELGGALPSKPMYHFCSMAQAEREAMFYQSDDDCLGVDAYGACFGYGTDYQWWSYYWCFYRGGIKRTDLAQWYQWNLTWVPGIEAGWIPCYFGCHWNYEKDNSLAGIGVGGSGGAEGTWPYANETINLSSATVLIGNASRYD